MSVVRFASGSAPPFEPIRCCRNTFMKKDIHPQNYREVVFRDVTTNTEWITRSTAKTEKTTEHKGKQYPLYDLAISSCSHPFYTGKRKLVDAEGRIERFNKKYGRKSS